MIGFFGRKPFTTRFNINVSVTINVFSSGRLHKINHRWLLTEATIGGMTHDCTTCVLDCGAFEQIFGNIFLFLILRPYFNLFMLL